MPSQIAPGLEIVSRGHGKLVFINCSKEFFKGGNSLEIYTQAFCKANGATTTPFDADFVKFSYETQVRRHFKEGDTELDLLLQQVRIHEASRSDPFVRPKIKLSGIAQCDFAYICRQGSEAFAHVTDVLCATGLR